MLHLFGFIGIGLFGLIVVAVIVAVIMFSITGSKYVQSKQDTKDE